MSWIVIALLGIAILMLVFSLVKKLFKLAFTAVALALLLAGLWYFTQEVAAAPLGDAEVGVEHAIG